VKTHIIEPTNNGLKGEQLVYQGFIFFGLINVNGDPETEVVIPRLENDLVELILAMNKQELNQHQIQHKKEVACTVMLVSSGYSNAYEKGLETVNDSLVFHAGTILQNNKTITNGGRVVAVTSLGIDLKESLKRTYVNAEKIQFEEKYFHRDIGYEFL